MHHSSGLAKRTLKDRIFDVLFVCVAVSAIVVAASIVRERFFSPPELHSRAIGPDSVEVADWKIYASVGHRMGDSIAPVTILEFADFECPACRRFNQSSLAPIRAKFGSSVSVVFRHWPLPYHKFALSAARASECASEQGKFEEFHDVVYEGQDSLGIWTMWDFAKAAGVPDSSRFVKCHASSGPFGTLGLDTLAARELKATGTPTVIINGWRWALVPDSARLDAIIVSALAKKRD